MISRIKPAFSQQLKNMPSLPPWLNVRPADFAQAAEAGNRASMEAMQIQNQAQQADAKMRQENALMQMQMKMRQDILKQQMARQQQQMANQTAYHQAEVGLGQGRLDESMKAEQDRMDQERAVQQAKAQDAAQKFAASQKFLNLRKSGVPADQALLQVPELMTPGTAASLARQAANPRPAPIPRRTLEQSVQDETLKSELNEINKQKAMAEPGSDTYKEMEQRAAEIEKKRLAILQPPAPTSNPIGRMVNAEGTKRMARFTS